MPIIESLLDTDQYILTMCQASFHQATKAVVKYKFKCRNGSAVPKHNTELFIEMLNEQIDHYCSLTFGIKELGYLADIKCGPKVPPLFKRSFMDFLRLFKPNRDHIQAFIDKNNDLQIIIEGPMYLVIWFEVPVLAMVSELNNRTLFNPGFDFQDVNVGYQRLVAKVAFLHGALEPEDPFWFVDFGTRRRYAKFWQERVIEYLIEHAPWFVGTSNLYFAMKFGIKAIGTMAHAWFQLFQRMRYRLGVSQKAALSAWVNEYQGDLGIALSDIGGFDWFLKDFNLYYAKLFDGCRHDSGYPSVWCKKLIKHYEDLRIDPKTKTAVFSDGLDFNKALALYFAFSRKIKTSFGIGTWLTNDMGVKEALQIVIKMIECNGGPVSKRSDSKGKGMCEDPKFDAYFGKVIAEETANGIVY